MARIYRRGRQIDGVLLYDKPKGISSNDALQKLKRLYNANKAGHTGTLDPLASGLLVICFGEATKFAQFLLNADKDYEVQGQLGITTTTGDSEGEIISEQDPSAITEQQLQQVLPKFMGTIEQIPPMFSALKHEGQPLYKLAREGVEVARKARRVTIHKLQLQEFAHGRFKLAVRCSKGTYIRTLVEDIGIDLKVGAHVTELRRVSVANLGGDQLVQEQRLQGLFAEAGFSAIDELLIPLDRALSEFPQITLDERQVEKIQHGQGVDLAAETTSKGLVRLCGEQGNFLGMGYYVPGQPLQSKRLMRQV